MLDITKRVEFEDPTITELIEELKKLPKETMINFNGYSWGYIHVDPENNYCCLASDPLIEDYEALAEDEE